MMCPLCGDLPGASPLTLQRRTLVNDEMQGFIRRRRVRTYDVRTVNVHLCFDCHRRIARKRHLASALAIAPVYGLFVIALAIGGGTALFAGLAAILYLLAFLSMLTWSWADALLYGASLETSLQPLIPRGVTRSLGDDTVRFPGSMLDGLARFGIAFAGPALFVAVAIISLELAPPKDGALAGAAISSASASASASAGTAPPAVELAGLHQAVREGRVDDARALLDHEPSLARSRYTTLGLAPLHTVSRGPETSAAAMVALLVDRGADVDAIDQDNATPLHVAVTAGRADLIPLLAARGASMARRRKDGATPLLAAVLADSPPMVNAVLKTGRADPNDRMPDGRRAYEIAAARAEGEIMSLLKTAGAER